MSCPALFRMCYKYVFGLSERRQVDLQHLESLLERLIYKFSVKTVTGVVQKNIDSDIASIQTRFQFCCGTGHTKINPFDHDIHTMPMAKLLSKPLHWFRASRGQYQIRLAFGQKLGELDTEAAGCSGHQSPFSTDVVHKLTMLFLVGFDHD